MTKFRCEKHIYDSDTTICPQCVNEMDGIMFNRNEHKPYFHEAIHSGKKHDTGKIPAHSPLAYFPRAIEGVAEVCAHGEGIHGFNTWSTIDDAVRRYQDADTRHELAICKGQSHDTGPKGSGLLHLKHRAWNALALLELAMREEEANVESVGPVRGTEG